MEITPYPFQVTAAEGLLSQRHSYLNHKMGLGKTVTACAAAGHLRPARALIVAPASVVPHWERTWPMVTTAAEPTVISYHRAVEAARGGTLSRGDWDVVIFDEGHFLKNPAAQRTQELIRSGVVRRSWWLSGTPGRHPGELYTAAAVHAEPGLLQDMGVAKYGDWYERYCRWRFVNPGNRRYVYGSQNEAELVPLLESFMDHKTEEMVGLELPELRIDLTPIAGGMPPISAEMESSARAYIEGEGEPAPKLRRLLGEYKVLPVAAQLARELREGEYQQLVIAAHHRNVIERLRELLHKFNPLVVDGRTKDKQAQIDTFTQDPGHRVMIVQNQAGGVGINLQASSELVLLEPDWDPDVNMQVVKRIHRIGSERPCRARIFMIAGTLDEGVMKRNHAVLKMQAKMGVDGSSTSR